jgi:hypothetical protein
MSNHKTTPSTDPCILELRARVMALEAQASNLKGSLTSSTPPTVATNEELLNVYDDTIRRHSGFLLIRCLRAIYNLGIEYGQASSRKVADPAPVAGGLVERITLAIDRAPFDEGDHLWDEARAAILEVAKWLREQGTPASGWAMRLEQEAGR